MLALFVVAIFAWGLGFYGHGVYLAELERTRGWSASLISSATTLYYLSGAGLLVFVGDIIERFGPRKVLIAGVGCFGTALVGLAEVRSPWQLFAVYLVMAMGWMLTSMGSITNIAGLWFFERRGLAISIALTGASFGGIVLTPLMVGAVGVFGFPDAMLLTAGVTTVVVVAVIVVCVGMPPALDTVVPVSTGRHASATTRWTRALALRTLQFWTATLPFSLGIAAQVGFLVHQIAFLEPKTGTRSASLAVALTTTVAVLGRLVVGAFVDHLNQRVVGAVSFLTQSIALFVLIQSGNTVVLFAACALFGFSVGNLITLPSLIIFREFGAESFGMLVGLAVAINQVVFSFGPGAMGWLRDLSGSYTVPFAMCIAMEIAAAIIILIPSKKAR